MDVAGSMQQELHTELVKYYMEKMPGISSDLVIQQLYATNTMQCLMNKQTEFYTKHINELTYLLDLELAGDTKNWRMQAVM